MHAGTDDGTFESSLCVGVALFITVGVSLLALCGKEGGARRPVPRKASISSASKQRSRHTRDVDDEKRFHREDMASSKEKTKLTSKDDYKSATGSSVPEDSGKNDDPSQPEAPPPNQAAADKVMNQQSPPQETPLLTDNYESLKEKEQADAVAQAAANTLAEVKRSNLQPAPPPEPQAAQATTLPAAAMLMESEKQKEKEKEKSESSSSSSSPKKKKKKSKKRHKKDKKSSRKKKSKRKELTNVEKPMVYPYVVTPPVSPSKNRLRIRVLDQKKPAIFDQKKTCETVVTEGGARPGEDMIEVEKSVYMAVPHEYAMQKDGIDPKTGLACSPGTITVSPINPKTGKPYPPGTVYATGVGAPIDPKTGLPYPPGTVYNTGVAAPIDPKTGLPYPPGTIYATGLPGAIDPKTGLPYPPGTVYNTGIGAPIDPKTGLPYPPGTVYGTGVPGSPGPDGLQTCVGTPTVCATGVGSPTDCKTGIRATTPKGVSLRTGLSNDEPPMDKTQVKTRNTQTTQHGTFETCVQNDTLAGIPPIEETCIEDAAFEEQPTQNDTVKGSLASMTAKRSTVETAVEKYEPEKTQKIGISLLSTRTGMERSDHTQNPTITDIDRTQINTLPTMKTQMSTNTLATQGSDRTLVSATQMPTVETDQTQISATKVTGCTENTQAATHAGTEGTQAPTLQTGVTMVNTGVGKTVQTTQHDGTYVTQITQTGDPTVIGRTNMTQDPTHIAQTTQTGGVSGTQITWSTGVATTQSHLGTTQTGCTSTFRAHPTQKSTGVLSTQTNTNVKAPVNYSLLGPPPGENGQPAGSPPTIVENGAKKPSDVELGPAPSNANQIPGPSEREHRSKKHRKKEKTCVSQTQMSELKPKKFKKTSKAEKIAELRLRKKATDYPTMNDVMSDWSSNDGIMTAAQMKEDDEKEILRRKMEHEKDEQRRRNEEELVRLALAKQEEEKRQREREEARQASQKPTTVSRAAQTPKQESKSRKEHKHKEVKHKEPPPPAVSPAPKTAKTQAPVTPKNREEEEERCRKIRENKPTPRKFQRSSWEEKIASGKVVRKKHDYPTMNDVISDWDSTDSSGASDQQPEEKSKK